MLVKSGIQCLDDRLGGLVERRAHLLTGAPGTGKTVACLEFLNAGLEDGEPCAMLTTDDPADLLAQCEFLGISFVEALASGRLVLLRYQLDFVRRFSRLATPERVFDELRRMLGDSAPRRVVIDSIVPFVEAGTASGITMAALVQWLEQLGSTSLLTLPGNLEQGFDRRFEPLARRAVAIVHFALERDRTIQISIQKARFPVPSQEPVRCRIEAGRGIVGAGTPGQRRLDDPAWAGTRRIVVLELGHAFPRELIDLLSGRFDVQHRSEVVGGLSVLAAGAAAAIVLGIDRDSLQSALALVRDLRRAGNVAPIVFITASSLRSSDGARALRAGVDEFVSMSLPLDELVLRIEATARRGRTAALPPATDSVRPAALQPPSHAALPADEFRAVVRTRVDTDPLPFFTIATLRPADGEDASLLAELVAGATRSDAGDVAGRLEDRVAVLLHSARRKDVLPFVDRLRAKWRELGGSELHVETATWPAEETQVDELLAAGDRAR